VVVVAAVAAPTAKSLEITPNLPVTMALGLMLRLNLLIRHPFSSLYWPMPVWPTSMVKDFWVVPAFSTLAVQAPPRAASR